MGNRSNITLVGNTSEGQNVGIGGAGMSGIADVMHTLGYQVSGSDIASSAVTERLKDIGVEGYSASTSTAVFA